MKEDYEYNFEEFLGKKRIKHDWKLEDWIEYQKGLIIKKKNKMKTKIFENYLDTVFMADYHGDKEHFEDAFENWLESLDTQEFIDHADRCLGQHFLQIQHAELSQHESMRKYFDGLIQYLIGHPIFWEAMIKKVTGKEIENPQVGISE